MQLTFLSSDLAEMTGKSQEQVRLVLNEWERQSGKPLPRGTSKERVLSLEVASLVLGAFRLMYPQKGKKKHTMGEAVALMLQEAQADGDHDPLRAAVRAELEPLRRLVVQEVAQHLTPLHQDLRQVSREMVEATREQVAQLVGQPDEDTPTLVEDLRDLVATGREGIENLALQEEENLKSVADELVEEGKKAVTHFLGQSETHLREAGERATRAIEYAEKKVGNEVTQKAITEIQEALRGQSFMVGIPILLTFGGMTLLLGWVVGFLMGRN